MKEAMDKPEHAVARRNNLAIMLEGPSRIGHYLRPSYFTAAGQGGRKEDGPIIQPLWRQSYQPFDKKLKGYKPHPTEYYFCEDMWIEA